MKEQIEPNDAVIVVTICAAANLSWWYHGRVLSNREATESRGLQESKKLLMLSHAQTAGRNK